MLENEFLGWNCETEVNLFHAMRGHKPVGTLNVINFHLSEIQPFSRVSRKFNFRFGLWVDSAWNVST